MNILRKITALLAVGTMLFTWGAGVLPESVREKLTIEVSAADNSGTLDNGLTYEITDEEATITGCDTAVTEIEIPAEIDGCPVTIIRRGVFENCTALSSIDIPDSVTYIGPYAFHGCESLTAITIPERVTTIAVSMFSGCSSLTSINIPNIVTYIENNAFEGCTELTSVDIPDSVIQIGSNAFSNCSSLISITIPDSVTSIGYQAFNNCISLTSINIPDSVISIGAFAFYNTAIYNETKNGIVYVDDWAVDCVGIYDADLILAEGTRGIAAWAFYECTSLTSITIPDSVVNIGSAAFKYCYDLNYVAIPDSVNSVGSDAFSDTAIYKSAEPENGVVYVDDWVVDCVGAYDADLILEKGSRGIAGNAFDGCTTLNSITIPDSVTEIGDYSFGDCTSLSTISIPDSVMHIGDSAFTRCESLTSVIIGEGVTNIECNAFYLCYKLTSVTIGNGVTNIGSCAFSYCTSLTDIYYTGTEEEWNAITINSGNECLTNATIHYNYVESIAFGTINGLKWTLTNEGVLTISGSGLMGLDSTTTAPWLSHADKITEVVIEEGVLDIGEAAFADCTSLTSVTISDSVYRIRQGAFKNCTALTSIVIPDGVSEIPAETFSGCALLAVIHIPRSLTAVGANAFNGCASLKEIYYAGIAADFDNVNMDASATDNVEEFLNLNWHYLDEYYYSNIDPKIYEQMRILCDKPTYYGNSQTVDIVKDYRNMAIADPEVESYNWWSNFNDVLDGDLTEEEFNETMTVEALITEIFLNRNLIDSFDRNTAEAVWNVNKEILTELKMNASDWGISEDSINTIDNLLSVAEYSTEFVDESTMKVGSILMEVNGQKLSAFETMLRGLSESSKVIGDVGTCLDLFDICYGYHQSKVENAAQLYNLYLICVAYHSSSAQFQQAIQLMSESVTLEMNKYTADDEFAQRMRKVGAMHQEYYRIMLDESMTAYQTFAEELDAETEFNRNFQLATFGAKKIAIAVIGVACPLAEFALESLGLALDVGISLWEITSEVDERSLERDKFLNMILFYDSFSNSLYSNEGFFGLLLDDPSETSYQTLVNGIQMYLVAEDMLLDYAIDYSRMLKRALKDWKKEIVLVSQTHYVKLVYSARYPDRSTSGRTVNSCWKELNSDMSDDDAQLLRFKHVFIDDEDFTGLRHIYYLTDAEAQKLGEKEYVKYQALKSLVEIYEIMCPVNITIKHGEEIAAKIENDEITYDNGEIFIDLYKESDDEYVYKYVILPEGYTLEITGFADGTMSFEKAIIENGNVTTISTITDIPVENGSVYAEVIEEGVTIALDYDQENDGVTDQTLTAEVTNVVILGDLNSDGEINASDAAMVLVAAAAVGAGADSGLTAEQEIAADVNGEGTFDAVDAAVVLQYAAAVGSGYSGTLDEFMAA